jgi:hypothetical protein
MKSSRVIEAAITELKGSGFWCPGTETGMRNLAANLKMNGIESDAVVADLITQMWTMISAEFGE